MDSLRRKPVVRESDVFSALFPRGLTPQHPSGDDRLPQLKGATASGSDETRRADPAAPAPSHGPRVPKLGVLSPKTPRALLGSMPMTASECAAVWKFLCDWVKTQVAMEAPAAIPGFGTVTLRTQALKIRIPFFEPERAFLDKHGLRVDVGTSTLQRTSSNSSMASRDTEKTADVMAFNYLEMAACCGKHVEPVKAKEWLQTVLQRVGEAMRQCQQVELDLGVGVVACTNRAVDSHLLPRHTATPSSVPFEVRTGESVVKRSLLALTSPKSPTGSQSFLISSDFSPAIQLHPAVQEDRSKASELFAPLEATRVSLRAKQRKPPKDTDGIRISSPSTGPVGVSPRTQRLRRQQHEEASVFHEPQARSVSLVKYTPLFDSISRTFCVEPDLNLSFLQPSNRIGSNYSPAALGLMMMRAVSAGASARAGAGMPTLQFTEEKLPCDSPFDAVITKTTRSGDHDVSDSSARAASEGRYFAYLDEKNGLMHTQWLAPLDLALVDRIVSSAIKYLNSKPTGHMHAVLDAAQAEFVANYNHSVKKTILDYLLLRSASRIRLSILDGTPSYTKLPRRWQWGDNKSMNGCMEDLKALAACYFRSVGSNLQKAGASHSRQRSSAMDSNLEIKKRRRKRIRTRLHSLFMLANPQVRALHYMWYEFEATVSLVKLPDIHVLGETIKPIDIHAFENEQLVHASRMKSYLMEQWYLKTRQLFEQAVQRSQRELSPFASIDTGRLRHLFDAVAVQMSLQIRSLIMKAVRAYVAFFEAFGTVRIATQPASASDDSELPLCNSALLVCLALHDREVQFRTPLMEVPSMLLSVLHNLSQLFHNINRIENQFEDPAVKALVASGMLSSKSSAAYSPFLWNVSPQEDEVVAATSRIREIIEQNLVQLHRLQEYYAIYGMTYRHVCSKSVLEGDDDATEPSTQCVEQEIVKWHAELQCVRVAADTLAASSRSFCRLHLFSVDCRQVNSALLVAFAQWSNRLLGLFAEKTSNMNSHLRQQYKDVAARLAKRPIDLYDLVEAEEFVEKLKTTKLQELQVKVDGIKRRMQFLLFERQDVHIGIPESDESKSPKLSVVFQVSNELLASTAKTIRWRAHIERLLQESEASLVGERARIEAVFLAKRNRFQAEIEEFDAEVKSFSKKGDLRHAATYVVQLAKMKDVLTGFRRQMEAITEEELKLQWKPTDFSKLDDIAEEMEPYVQLWKTAREFRELNSKWLRTNVFELVAHEGMKALHDMMTTISTVSNLLHLNSAATAITAEMVKKQMADFRENAKIVAAILNPSVQDRHLKEMSTLLGLTIDPQEPITLLKLLENGAYDHLAHIIEISGNATMEKQIEDALRAILIEWQGVRFSFKVPTTPERGVIQLREEEKDNRVIAEKSSSPPMLSRASVDEIKLLIEDHQLRLHTLQCLPHAVPFFGEISCWLSFLDSIFTIADLCVMNQLLWKRLHPLFSADIIEDTAEEVRLFAKADALFRTIILRISNQPTCTELVTRNDETNDISVVAGGDTPLSSSSTDRLHEMALLTDLKTCHELLERVKENVSVGFEARRSQFPRFYLLSDVELVAVLAHHCRRPIDAQHPSTTTNLSDEDVGGVASPALWSYLRLCFSGVRRVQANPSSPQQELTAFISVHGEQVPIGSPIATLNVPIATWLAKLETAMVTILQACTRAAINDFNRKEFRKWCLLWPEQVLCTTIRHIWTMQSEISNNKSSLLEARTAWQAEVQVLDDRIEAVSRELKAAGTPSTRLALSNVLLLLRQLRDVSSSVLEELVNTVEPYSQQQVVLSEDDELIMTDPIETRTATCDHAAREPLTWLSQPRFYYDSNAALGVKFLSFAPLPYGFEYVGNASPAVYVSPMTLRCFHALALHAGMLHKGSFLTESVTSGRTTACTALARLCGRLLITYDGQDQQHEAPLHRFQTLIHCMKATVSCGAWLLTENLHLLASERYLSLFSSVCSQVLDSQAAKHTHTIVLGHKLRLKRGVHFVATESRHGVSAAAPLPVSDYLRSAFRPVAVHSHDTEVLTAFFLERCKMMHTKTVAKLINGAVLLISRTQELLLDNASVVAQRLVNVRSIHQIVQQASRRCVQERQFICSAHGWPPAPLPNLSAALLATPIMVSGRDMPVDLVRDIERMEVKAVSATLREYLSSATSVQMAELVEFVLRDFVPVSLPRELRSTKSFMVVSAMPPSISDTAEGGVVKGGKAAEIPFDALVERTVRDFAEVTGFSTTRAGPISQKAVQLFHALQTNRAVVVVGDIQNGKTYLREALEKTLTHLFAEARSKPLPAHVRPTRTVVVHPRALTQEQLFGSPSSKDLLTATRTVVAKLIQECKQLSRSASSTPEQTWIVLDGDINESWAGRFLQLTELREAEEAVVSGDSALAPAGEEPRSSRMPGLLLPCSVKRMLLPLEALLLFETTTLKDVSPSFLSKVGVVHVGGMLTEPARSPREGLKSVGVDWRGVYRMWKKCHSEDFAALHDELFSLLDVLVDETLDACLDFVVTQFASFQADVLGSSRRQSSQALWRVKSFFCLLHSFLAQSWANISAMVSGKQRKNAMHCYFLQALMWGIGHTSDALERHKFHAFVRQWIIQGPRSADSSLKRVLTLHFPSGSMGTVTGAALQGMGATQRTLDITGGTTGPTSVHKDTLYSFCFSVELGQKWMRWPELYDAWLSDRYQLSSDRGLAVNRNGHRGFILSAGVPEDSVTDNGTTDASTGLSSFQRDGRLFFYRTPNMAAAVYLLYQLMASGYTGLLSGARGSGKTTCGRVWMELHALFAQLQQNAASATSGLSSPETCSDSSVEDGRIPERYELIYTSSSVRARHIVEQLQAFVERKRVYHHRRRHLSEQGQESENNATTGKTDVLTSTVVFFDDLNALAPGLDSNSALELARGLLERKQVVHPTANSIIPCEGLALFGSVRCEPSVWSSELERLVARFVPIALAPVTDSELSSICSAYIAAGGTTRTPPPGVADARQLSASELSFNPALQEASQLMAMLIKATVKMYRILSSDHWSLTPSSHLQAAGRAFAARVALQPTKAHYLFHVQDVFRVLQSVCCDTKQVLSMAEKLQVVKLWCHETARVFGDRLIDDRDAVLFYQVLNDVATSHFTLTPDSISGDLAEPIQVTGHGSNTDAQAQWLKERLHFTFIGESSGAGMLEGYREVHELHKVELSIERTMMAMYRANVVTESLPFVLCSYAIGHIIRLSRVLRHKDQHLLLIGKRGTKMRALVRLSAFICHKTTSTFYVPRGSKWDISAWHNALKSVLLQSVRLPRDDCLVLIVKDMWLDNLNVYAALDRFLSGAKLLSDIISYEDFDESILQAMRSEAERDRRGADTADGSSSSPRGGSTAMMHSKSSAVEYFFTIVRRKLQFAIIMAQPSPAHRDLAYSPWQLRFAELMTRYPHIQKQCTMAMFGEWPEESLQVIAQKCLSPLYGTEKDRLLQLSQAAVRIFLITRVVWNTWASPEHGNDGKSSDTDRPRTSAGYGAKSRIDSAPLYRPSASIQVEPSMLVEHLSLFSAHQARLQREVDTNKAKYAAGLAFIERTEQILALGQSQQQHLEPEMAKKSAMTRRMSGNLEKEKLMTTKLQKALELDRTLVENQRARLAQVESEYESLISETREMFEQCTEAMRPIAKAMTDATGSSGDLIPSVAEEEQGEQTAALTEASRRRQRRALVRTFTSITEAPTSLRQLAQCIGVIFGIEPVEARDELDPEEIVMDYWESTARFLQSRDFWQGMMNFDVRQRMNENVVAKVLPICSAPDFEMSHFSSIHELAGLLCEWVQSCANYGKDFVLAEPKFAQLCSERQAYEAATAQLRARQAEIHLQSSTTSQVNAMRTLSEQERREIEEKLKENTSTLQMTKSVWKVLEPCKAKWKALYDYYMRFSVQAMGDLMLATAMMAYASSASRLVRRRLRALWSEEVNKNFIVHSPADQPRALREVFLIDDRPLTKWYMDGLLRHDASALECTVMTTQSFLFPVLIDPHRVATDWLKKHYVDTTSFHDPSETADGADRAAVVLSGSILTSETIWETIARSVKKKRPVIVEDFNDVHATELLSVLQSKMRSRFDVVNRDISSVASSGVPATAVSVSTNAPATSMALMRRLSSVGIGLGINAATGSGASGATRGTVYGVYGNHRCWFELPFAAGRQGASERAVMECGSDSCRIIFIYSRTEIIPDWLAVLASHVSLIRVEFSPTHIRDKVLRTILDAHPTQSHVLTEVQALQVDMISCDEQIETIENEILDFFSIEDPVQVYTDTAKALKIVSNRSALHTLENSKLESSRTLQHHYLRLATHGVLIRRCVDIVHVWRDLGGLWENAIQLPPFPIDWVWKSLSHALTRCAPSAAVEEQCSLLTALVRRCLGAAYGGTAVPDLFDLILGLRIYHRRNRMLDTGERDPTNGLPSTDEEGLLHDSADDEKDDLPPIVSDLLPRVLQVLECGNEADLKTICVGVSSKLLTALPSDIISVHTWRAVCYLAEKHAPLRELILSHTDHSSKETWKDVLKLEDLLHEDPCGWSAKTELDGVTKLCLVAALRKELFLSEAETFSSGEIERLSSSASRHEDAESISKEKTAVIEEPSASVVDVVSAALALTRKPQEVSIPKQFITSLVVRDLLKIYTSVASPVVIVHANPETAFHYDVSAIAELAKANLDNAPHEAETSKEFEQLLLTAIRKGHWVVLSDVEATPSQLDIVTRIVTTIHTHDPHSDFRLWLLSSSPWQTQLLFTTMMLGIAKQRSTLRESVFHAVALIDEWRKAQSGNVKMKSMPWKSAAVSHTLLRVGVAYGLLACYEYPIYLTKPTRTDFVVEICKAVCQMVAQESTLQSDVTRLLTIARLISQQVYGGIVKAAHEHLALTCCLNLVFSPSEENDSFECSFVMDAALRVLPEVAHLLRALNTRESVSSESLLASVQSVWPSQPCITSKARVELLHTRLQPRIHGLRQVLEYRGILGPMVTQRGMTPSSPGQRGTSGVGGRTLQPSTTAPPSPLVSATVAMFDVIRRFRNDLENYIFDESTMNEKYPREYKRPLNELLRYEVARLRDIRHSLVGQLRQLQAVGDAELAADPSLLETFAALSRDETPVVWLCYLLPSESDRMQDTATKPLSLESFQRVILDRFRYFQAWVDLGVPSRIVMDKFQSSVPCVLETIHHHFVRTMVGTMQCSGAPHCIRIVRIYENRAQMLPLPIRDETMYLSGWKLFGHLQLEVVSSPHQGVEHQPRRSHPNPRPPTASHDVPLGGDDPNGVPVIAEITTACLTAQSVIGTSATGAIGNAGIIRSLPPNGGPGTNSIASSRRSSVAASYEYNCPILRAAPSWLRPLDDFEPAPQVVGNLMITTMVPIPQLVFSGSHLRICSPGDPTATTGSDRL